MITVPDVHCTCGLDSGDERHEPTCALQYCDPWVTGKVTWFEGALHDPEVLWGWDDVASQPTLIELEEDATTDDDEIECTCYEEGDLSVAVNSKHSADCDLQHHTAWMEGDCEWNHQTRSFEYYDTPKTTSVGSWSGTGAAQNYGGYGSYGGMLGPTCDHDGTKAVTFPDGTLIYPSSSYSTSKRDSIPDYALYLETHRTPVSAAIYIPWKDYGLPEIDFRHAADIICDTFALAHDGMTVEVGCIGAHGRTGTVLACMAILAGVALDDAVEWTKTNHCEKAVESERQEWFVAWFHAYVHQLEAPPTPPIKPLAPPSSPGKYSTSKATTGTGTSSLFTNDDASDDLQRGDPCPRCATPLVTFGQKIACNTKDCSNYDGLARCVECNVCLDAQPLEGYCCWNMHCKRWKIKAGAPAAKSTAPPQKTKGRKKWKK